jgi:hypothetical protein
MDSTPRPDETARPPEMQPPVLFECAAIVPPPGTCSSLRPTAQDALRPRAVPTEMSDIQIFECSPIYPPAGTSGSPPQTPKRPGEGKGGVTTDENERPSALPQVVPEQPCEGA